ncbi:type IVB secretion system protein IcmH/DotU [Ideonella sp. BN130291]|uniref:type IVB secretion system protein IcmH/DotU n=1 Tax=Ideonella sp. BN130291 TaxID=3112940 RepID=UPI002E275D5C|nr:type IVB secretion system protein IcmH/DotU [Ideonella sp. BN130291]
MAPASSNPPSLFGASGPGTAPQPRSGVLIADAHSLLDLMYDGFYMLFLLKNRHAPLGFEDFRQRLRDFLTQFERGTRKLDCSAEDIYNAKYAFCALVDETVLMSQFKIRDEWQLRPLQLEYFGDQLAGETFFEKLEELRRQGAAKLQVLEVFHMCLLLGFQGKYLLEGTEKLNYLTVRLGDEIAHLRGTRPGFAPHGLLPDRVAHTLRNDVPLWVVVSVFALGGLLAFIGLRAHLARSTGEQLAAYSQLVKLAPRAANVTITLP